MPPFLREASPDSPSPGKKKPDQVFSIVTTP
jgi:hypothetical protein